MLSVHWSLMVGVKAYEMFPPATPEREHIMRLRLNFPLTNKSCVAAVQTVSALPVGSLSEPLRQLKESA
jgi:hypothetical protein